MTLDFVYLQVIDRFRKKPVTLFRIDCIVIHSRSPHV
jgi:hypothetical protein